MDQDAGL